MATGYIISCRDARFASQHAEWECILYTEEITVFKCMYNAESNTYMGCKSQIYQPIQKPIRQVKTHTHSERGDASLASLQ